MALSVIVATSPGREENLRHCLAQLARQTFRAPFEVIVADDGSHDGAAICQAWEGSTPVQYLWRPTDQCVARSRNQGARAAQYDQWVFIDADILLHPGALQAYSDHLFMKPNYVLYGYYGYHRDYQSTSVLVPGRAVHWCDKRYEVYTRQGLSPAPNLLRFPHEWAWSGSFALHRAAFEQVQGFDEGFVGWGGEDLDFADRLIRKGYQIHFVIDAWGEHQIHPVDEAFHQGAHPSGHRYQSHYTPAPYAVQVFQSPEPLKELTTAIYEHYMPHDPFFVQQIQPHP